MSSATLRFTISKRASWELPVFGTPRLAAPDGREWRPERKRLGLLTYLALEGATSRSRLAALLWPETPGSGARNNLVHLLRRLRAQSGEELVTGQDVLMLVADLCLPELRSPDLSKGTADFPDSPGLAGDVAEDELPPENFWAV
ncbi:hypothetical protein ACFFLM_04780 [Deinococcus oregonensis]|uniref:SARP family transcriptional regulator n=1 Tax=Deinococcus oregonensis TaxID=1805970 RepID=A0ABV6AUV7_9DEIO